MDYLGDVPARLLPILEAAIEQEELTFQAVAANEPRRVYGAAVLFAAYAILECQRAVLREGSFTWAQFLRQVPDFQRRIAARAYYDKVPHQRRSMHGDESFLREVEEALKKLPEWPEHLRERLGIAQAAATLAAPPSPVEVVGGRETHQTLDSEPATSDTSTVSTNPRSASAEPVAASPHVFEREGSGWRVVFQGKSRFVKDRRGMALTQQLLAEPEREFSPRELLKQEVVDQETETTPVTGYADSDPTFDDDALKEIRARTERLRNEIEIATVAGDEDRKSKLEDELLAIADHWRRDTDDRGRPRPLGSEAEKARKTAKAALTRARELIGEQLPELADRLAACVKTGPSIVYRPKDGSEWQTSR